MFKATAELANQKLAPAESSEHFRLHLAALEWSLADAIVIETRVKTSNQR